MILSDRPVAGDLGTDERIDCPDGYYWVRPTTREALVREGHAMKNCLADRLYPDFVGHERLSAPSIWSLRRKSDGRSIADIELYFLEVLQVRGVANNLVGPQAAKQIEHLIARYRRNGLEMTFHHACKVLVAPDGRTWRRDKAPADLVAAQISEAKARLLAARTMRRQMLEAADAILALEQDYDAAAVVVWNGGRATVGADVQVRQ
ncbi:MAG: hypothetical protein EOP19_06765 [Hyphomicrobiales bacterium]|nr:MAG: hypothetical protein EOP19_06765 [Hyphomicrobiales bacterium]